MMFLKNNQRLLIIALAVLWSWATLAWGNDSIPFLCRSHLFVPACINNEYQANVIFDTGGSDLFGVDSVYFSASAWHPQKIGRAKMANAATFEADYSAIEKEMEAEINAVAAGGNN